MAVTLSVKNVPNDLARRLRARAARNHRSLQGELLAILEQAAQVTTLSELVALASRLGVKGASGESEAIVRAIAMRVVVDASALGAIAFGEPEAPALGRYLEDETLIAPTLLDYELTNLAITKVRRGVVSPSEATLLLVSALRLPIGRVACPARRYSSWRCRRG